MKKEDEIFELDPILFNKPELLITKYLTNGQISSKIDSGVKTDMLARLTKVMHEICKNEGMATDEQDIIAI